MTFYNSNINKRFKKGEISRYLLQFMEENKMTQELEQKLEQTIQLEQVIENEMLKEMLGKKIIFSLRKSNIILGKLNKIGINFIEVINANIIEDYGIEKYLQSEFQFVRDRIEKDTKTKVDKGVYNKKDITELYEF